MPWPLLLWGGAAVVTAVAGYAGYEVYKEDQEEKKREARRRSEKNAERERQEQKRRADEDKQNKKHVIMEEYGENYSDEDSQKVINSVGEYVDQCMAEMRPADQDELKVKNELEDFKKSAIKKD